MRRGWVRLICAVLGVSVLWLAGCSSDDGASVRETGDTSAGSGTGAGSGSGSGTGISEDSLAGTTDNPLVTQAVTEYKTYVLEQIDSSIAGAAALTAAIQGGDLEAAKAAYAPSREGWERIEPIAGLVEDIDGKVDARVDDFASETDPEFTGWHRIEYLLWEQNDTASALPFAQELETNLADLKTQMEAMEIPPAAVAVGASELIDEVSQGKITGEEDRYSHTDMWDLAANVEGSEKAIELLTPALQEADPALLQSIQTSFTDVDAIIVAYAVGDGYQLFTAVTPADIERLKTTTAQLSEQLSQVAGTLGLEE